MRILGVDYGGKRTGLAIWDDQANLVLPLRVVEGDSPAEAARQVAEAAVDEGVERIVVGQPRSMSGEAGGEQAKEVGAFFDELCRQTDVEVLAEDERMTTDVADRLISQGDSRKQSAPRDALAAAAILETYLIRAGLMDPRP